jgi:hypothetical protein
MKKITTTWLVATLLMTSLAQASSSTDIDSAIRSSNQQVCDLQNDVKAQIDIKYADLAKLQEALEQAQHNKPYVETLNSIRKASTVAMTISILAAASSYKLGQGQWKSAALMDLNQYVLAISVGAAKVSAIAALASETGYKLTSQDIEEFKNQIEQVKTALNQLRQELQGC